MLLREGRTTNFNAIKQKNPEVRKTSSLHPSFLQSLHLPAADNYVCRSLSVRYQSIYLTCVYVQNATRDEVWQRIAEPGRGWTRHREVRNTPSLKWGLPRVWRKEGPDSSPRPALHIVNHSLHVGPGPSNTLPQFPISCAEDMRHYHQKTGAGKASRPSNTPPIRRTPCTSNPAINRQTSDSSQITCAV